MCYLLRHSNIINMLIRKDVSGKPIEFYLRSAHLYSQVTPCAYWPRLHSNIVCDMKPCGLDEGYHCRGGS
jgi:hypothetical protein